MGLREAKKERTREALVEAAVRLFEENGYERTTVAQIAAAAQLSTRTFFLHFATKEDVLLANSVPRVELGVAALGERRSGESPARALARAIGAMVADASAKDLPTGLAAARTRLVATEPAVQARLLQRMATAQSALAEALRRAYPDELDPVSAAAVTGAALGAVSAAAVAALREGLPPERVRAAMLGAPAVAAFHLAE
ncbi:helix-turn-helix domain containing protein [Nonomuraea sp. MCN248]|uniref:Helix-turn-helix domain containing protein n=1 Tax=Nonomuraea corallina TaxID=2989783 RepID=A0ABT4SLL5_9ACTN|nr:TetR/AcrR family transcriptional regulator [Nonomuraea corallina]MDA0638121.1 helix-turn-helix domain containing protein [Nonomuraea corallina]